MISRKLVTFPRKHHPVETDNKPAYHLYEQIYQINGWFRFVKLLNCFITMLSDVKRALYSIEWRYSAFQRIHFSSIIRQFRVQ